jgi:hypothetical protein
MPTSSNINNYNQFTTTTEAAPVMVSNRSSPSPSSTFPSDGYPPPAYTATTATTASIPITHNSSSLRRTESETQLFEDEVEADYKDFLFYSRIVNGIISKQHSFHQDGSLKHETQQCLENIVRARHDGKQGEDQQEEQYHDSYRQIQQAQPLPQQMVSPVRKQLGYYYYATTSNTGESIKYLPSQQRMLRFATRALVLSGPGDMGDDDNDEENREEGIFDLEL